METQSRMQTIEKWDVFEMVLEGSQEGNPFMEVSLSALFIRGSKSVEVKGFYDGSGIYRVRFMPEQEGEWSYQTRSNLPELDGIKGSFHCVSPSEGNHGPVTVYNTFHFRYADGTPFYPVGTTCYAWIHQDKDLIKETLKTLERSPFNKVRMLVFPKYMEFNRKEPELFPFERLLDGSWNFTRFDPRFFHHLEERVKELRDLGIEADIILFHPYDKGHWGFDSMGGEADDRYLAYITARLASFRNVWWSMANEYDLLEHKTMDDWDRFFQILEEEDPYGHLRSIHNWGHPYDYSKPWVTHCSYQTPVTSRGLEEVPNIRKRYGKPVIVDECLYEGDIEFRWGNITAQEMVRRFWIGVVSGCYVTHGETYLHPDDVLWWAKGGSLHGESPERIAFLRKILEEGPEGGIDPAVPWRIWRELTAGKGDEYFLLYLGFHQPVRVTFDLPRGYAYHIDIIDTWEMTIKPLEGSYKDSCMIQLPRKPYMALRIVKIFS